jgi:hypothetical protein
MEIVLTKGDRIIVSADVETTTMLARVLKALSRRRFRYRAGEVRIATGYTDMPRGMQALALQVQEKL